MKGAQEKQEEIRKKLKQVSSHLCEAKHRLSLNDSANSVTLLVGAYLIVHLC